jgi:hypothetical protein
MLRSLLALLMILLAAPACAGSGFPAFHRSSGLILGFFGGYFCCLDFYNPGYGLGTATATAREMPSASATA